METVKPHWAWFLAGPAVLVRLWLGNLILAAVFATVGYLVALRLVVDFRRRVA